MALVVQKYGGSSVADAEALHRVARGIVQTREAGHDVAVVVSAMGDTTDELLDLTASVTKSPTARELDMVLTSGERISMALLAMAIHDLEHPAVSFTGAQAGLRTTDDFGAARILEVTPDRITETLRAGAVAIVAGFQGWSEDDDVTTLGRGGSDTTAVALAAALNADVCEIYTDVDGLFSADPRVVSQAQQLPVLTSEEALELCAHGAKILHLRSVEFARRHGVPLHVRSSFGDGYGTWVTDDMTVIPADHPTTPQQSGAATPAESSSPGHDREEPVEEPVISGVAHSHDQSKVTVTGVPDAPGSAAAIFAVITGAVSTVDMIGQTHTAADTGLIDFSFALPVDDGRRAMDALRAAQERLGFADLTFTDEVGKVSVVGVGMRSTPEVPAQLFEALAQAGITVHLISTSEIRLSAVVEDRQVEEATRVLHEAFGLNSDVEAVVHAGTGR